MKALITGSNGFVGRYLSMELAEHGYEVTGTDIAGDSVEHVDFLDLQAVSQLLTIHKPDVVFHLAGQASVGLSWQIPRKTIDINVGGTINLLDAARQCKIKPKLLIVGSSDQYGVVKSADCPIRETLPQNPNSPYAISKTMQELTAQALSKAYGLDIIFTRSFNHIGPGQKKGFVISDFSSAIAEIEAGKKDPVLHVGNLDAQRDFTDVRDIVRAYRLLTEKGKTGEVYNIGSGVPYSIKDILEKLLSLSKANITVEKDPEKMRVSDNPLISCCYEKLQEATGWKPVCSLDETLSDTLNSFRSDI
jgi:GDP-4-dehydro-6-deoxy-D-mannose reductase